MKLAFQISLALLIGLGALYPGVMSFFMQTSLFTAFFNIDLVNVDPALRLAIETQVRLLAGMWLAAGIFLLLAVPKFQEHRLLIRLVLAGMALSAVGELLAAQQVNGDMANELLPSLFTITVCLVLECWREFLSRKMDRGGWSVET